MGSPTVTTDILKPAPLAPSDRLRVGLVGAGVISSQYLASIARLPDLDLAVEAVRVGYREGAGGSEDLDVRKA